MYRAIKAKHEQVREARAKSRMAGAPMNPHPDLIWYLEEAVYFLASENLKLKQQIEATYTTGGENFNGRPDVQPD